MFLNRIHAGNELVKTIPIPIKQGTIVLAIPRGGVIIGHQIAQHFNLQLDVVVSKKLCPPGNLEFGVGSILHDGTIYMPDSSTEYFTKNSLKDEIAKKTIQVQDRLKKYRGNSDYNLEEKNIILVDDGIATGSTVFVVVEWLKTQKIDTCLIASPVIPSNVFKELKQKFSDVCAIYSPNNFVSVSEFYDNFDQVPDEHVMDTLANY